MSSIAFNESKVPLGSRELNSTNYRPARAHKHLKENRYSPLKFEMVYHGTNLESAEQIRKHGFRLNKKMKGATNVLKEASGISDENHRHFHYVSRSFTEAASYAKIYKEPEILSIVCPSEILMPDYASANEQTALKFKKDLDQRYIISNNPEKINFDDYFEELGVSKEQRPIFLKGVKSKREVRECLEKVKSAVSAASEMHKTFETVALKSLPDFANLLPGQSVDVSLSESQLKKMGLL